VRSSYGDYQVNTGLGRTGSEQVNPRKVPLGDILWDNTYEKVLGYKYLEVGRAGSPSSQHFSYVLIKLGYKWEAGV
jgi:hypothetical protein